MSTNVSELISKILGESFAGRMDNLEKRFEREANDITTLENTVDVLKTNLEASARAATEPGAVSAGNSKAVAKGREKSVGPGERGKSLARDKSVKNVGDKGMSKTKTVTNLKKGEESRGTSMSKTKSTANMNRSDSTKNLPKTPKTPVKSSAKTATQTPEKQKSTKSLTKTPTEKGSLDKSLKKNGTVKKIETEGEKKGLMKSGTKGNLLKGKSAAKEEKKNEGEKVHVQTHPKREENISIAIGVGVTNTNDELLTKEEGANIDNAVGNSNDSNQPAVLSNPKLDLSEIIDDRWSGFSKYWTRYDHAKFLRVNKIFGKLSINHLISDIQKEIIDNEGKIKALRDKTSPDDLNKEQNPFALTRGALKAVELLNESLYLKLFQDSPVPSDDIILTYKLFFQLLKMTDFVEIKDLNEFWKKTCEYFINEGGQKLGTFVQNLVKNIDFSNENILKLTKMVGNNLPKINPNYFSKNCGTSGLFIFLIKDAFEYAGIIVDKKTSPARLYKNYMYVFEDLQGKVERLKKIQSAYFS